MKKIPKSNGTGGWTIDPDFLEKIRETAEEMDPNMDLTYWEVVEAILKAMVNLGYAELEK